VGAGLPAKDPTDPTRDPTCVPERQLCHNLQEVQGMRLLRPLTAVGAASALLASIGSAQLPPIAYSAHFQPMSDPVAAAFSGPGLFTTGTVPNYASQGDSIRRCYGIDTTQGGRNQSTGNYETTHFKIAQGWAASNLVAGNDIGIVSVQSGSDSDIGGDACFAPFDFTGAGTVNGATSAAALLGLQTGTAGFAFPTVWQSGFQWAGSSSASFQGVAGSATLGTSGTSGGVADPLLVNVIYEIQGPLNGGPTNNQYYLASTTETPGDGGNASGGGAGASYGTGGVTNGNSAHGSSLFGVDAAVSGAISHTRILSLDAATGTLSAYTLGIGIPGDVEMGGHVAFQTPGLWGIKNGSSGSGANDWQVSAAPVSVVDLRYNDHLAGAQTNADTFAKSGGAGGPPAAGFVPTIVFNQPFFLWSSSAAVMTQSPMSWDNLGGLIPAQAGSAILGAQLTSRQGAQTLPMNFDAVTAAILGVAPLSLGTKFSASDDIFFDGTVTVGGASTSAFWEGMFSTITSGVSGFGGGALPIVGAPSAGLTGLKVGIAALGIQVDALVGVVDITEVGSALTLNFQ